jgi:hypothetical protein
MSALAPSLIIAESLDKANKGLRSVKDRLVTSAPPNRRLIVQKKYDVLTEEINKRKESLQSPSVTTATEVVDSTVDLSAELGKLQTVGLPDDLKTPIRALHTDLELHDRLFALTKEAGQNLERVEASLMWFSQKKDGRLLDFLFENGTYLAEQYGQSTATLLNIAEEGILERGYPNILTFYSCTPAQIRTTIAKTTEQQKHIQPVSLTRYFQAELPTQVLNSLSEIEQILEDFVEKKEIPVWLQTPNKLFDNESPRNTILDGNTFKIYQFLIGLAQGVHI